MVSMIARTLAERVRDSLRTMPAVFLQGARQVGKTTLARQLIAEGVMVHYVSFDDPIVLASVKSDPLTFVRNLPPRIVLDEVQGVPELLPLLRLRIDERREPGDLLLTGSATSLALSQVADTLVGRMAVLTLMPLSQGEIEGVREHWIERVFEGEPSFCSSEISLSDLSARLVRGGYPAVVTCVDETARSEWLSAYLDTILARNVHQIADIERLVELPRLLRLLATGACQTLNVANLSRESGIPQATLNRYLAVLEALFLWIRVPAWYANLGKRLLKSPKVMLNDTGLLAMLVGADEKRLAQDPLLLGRMVENFVGMELLKQITFTPRRIQLYHFRTDRGEEVDFVLEDAGGTLVGVEVKATATIGRDAFRGLRVLKQMVGDKLRLGVVLYPGPHTLPFEDGFWVQPISALWSA
ncbi:MAG: hypothetical protein C4335_11620 [Armatimonadota bacterium]